MPFPSRYLPSDVFTNAPYGIRRIETNSINFRDYVITRGLSFFSDYEQVSIPVGAKTYAQFTTPVDKYLLLYNRNVVTDRERFFYRSYGTYSAVTNISPINIMKSKTNSAIETESTFFSVTTPTTIDQASRIASIPVFGAADVGNNSSGEFINDSVFRVFEPGMTILLEFENASASAIYAQFSMNWLELPEFVIRDGL